MSNRIRLRCNPDETGTHFREWRGTVHYDEAGIPVVLELRCRNRECCQALPGHYAVHLFTLHGVQNEVEVGEYVTKQIPFRSFADLPLGARKVPGTEKNRAR